MRRALWTTILALGAASGACACSSGSSGSARPAGPPAITVVALRPGGGPVWKPGDSGCVELGRDADATIGIQVSLENWTLRPPYTCGATPQCGYVRVQVDPAGDGAELSAQAAASLVSVPFASLQDALGAHTLRVELRGDHNGPVIDKKTGQPYAVDLQITLGAPGTCGGAPLDAGDSGADASDAATDASDAGDATTDASDAATD